MPAPYICFFFSLSLQLIVDTSGRLSNNVALNEELKKMKRTIADRIPGGPHETLLVLDGAVGRNGVDQAKVWNREVGITGLVITKLDGTARGGVVVSIVRDVGVPVKLIGVGEGISDLRDFDPEVFVDALLGYEVSRRRIGGGCLFHSAAAAECLNVLSYI